MELQIPQLTLAKIAQMGGQEIVDKRTERNSPRVEGSIPIRGNCFAEFILLYYNYGRMLKPRVKVWKSSQLEKHGISSLHNLTWTCYLKGKPHRTSASAL